MTPTTGEPAIAFAVPTHEQPAIEIRINFGVFAGRQASPAEIDRLAARLLQELESVTIIAEERHEIGNNVEASVHQVRIELTSDQVPADAAEGIALETRLVERANVWARECIDERHFDAAD
jgi:hypothetical protein